MLTGKFCFHCGGALDQSGHDMECSSCGAVYSNLLVSETVFDQDNYNVLEIGFTADITVRTPLVAPVMETPVPQDITTSPLLAEATA